MTLGQLDDSYYIDLCGFDEFVKDFKHIHGQATSFSSTDFYIRADFDDGSFLIEQPVAPKINKTLRFGPLKATLSELYSQGFRLFVESFSHRRKHKLILRNTQKPREAYKLATIFNVDLRKNSDLSIFVKDHSEPHYQLDKPVGTARDPLDELKEKYPVKPKHVKLIGNLTFEEYVKQQLKQNRR